MSDPFMDAGTRGWFANTARRELWRLGGWYTFDDLLQDGYMCYYKCRNAYPELSRIKEPTRDNRREFMALVKAAFANHIHTLADKQRRGVVSEDPVSLLAAHKDDERPEDAYWDQHLPPELEQATLRTLLVNAPAEIVQLLQLLVQDGVAAFERTRVGRRALRETTNEYYCRLLNLDPATHDMVGRVKAYFGRE